MSWDLTTRARFVLTFDAIELPFHVRILSYLALRSINKIQLGQRIYTIASYVCMFWFNKTAFLLIAIYRIIWTTNFDHF